MTWPIFGRRAAAYAVAVFAVAWFASFLAQSVLALPKRIEVAKGSPKAVAKVEGRGVPGREVRLQGGESKGSNLQYRWIQVRGRAVPIEGTSSAEARIKIPEDGGPLGFLLVVSGPTGSDAAEVKVPIEVESVSSGAGPIDLTADAGDDLIGMVGQQVTLNGGRSEPRGRVGFRWIQTGGPAVRFKLEEGYIHSFVPPVPGVYRFSLVVASGSTISAPDEVVVRVGSGLAERVTTRDAIDDAKTPKTPQAIPIQEVARAGLAAIRGGGDLAEPLAKVFEDTAHRMGVYQTYAEAFSEMSRRFEELLPTEPTRRQRWMDRVFQPLTARTLEVLRAEGLELLRADGPEATLDEAQKAALAEQFQLIAEGFRTVTAVK